MVFICTTRFNTETLQQNCAWKRRHQIMHECVYGSPIPVKRAVRGSAWMIVLEMQNDVNKIVGIGLVKNSPNLPNVPIPHSSGFSGGGSTLKPSVYNCGNYNRFIYQGAYRIDLLSNEIELTREEELVIKMLELALFYGANHSKRGKGICELPKHVASLYDFKECLKQLVQRFIKIKKGLN
jgi:hypothetical protein